jgi:Transglutaminase-like superfamily
MKKKIKYGIRIFLLLLLVYILWMSPYLFGLLPGGKPEPDMMIQKIAFDQVSTGQFNIPYTDESKKPELVKLRAQFKLDTLVNNTQSDYEKVQRIQSWVQSRWEHDGNNIPLNSDPIYLLEEAAKGKKFRCVEYSIVASACLKSFGFITRGLGLKTKDVNDVKSGAGHVVNEVYVKDLKKWMFLDPQNDIIVTLNGVPLNAVEFQSALINKDSFELVNHNVIMTKDEYVKWIGPYLFYFTTSLNKGPVSVWDRIIGNKKQLTLVPKGFEPPKFFQRIFRITTEVPTYSEKDFYPSL